MNERRSTPARRAPQRQINPEAVIRQLGEDVATLKQRLIIAYDDLIVLQNANNQLTAELEAAKGKTVK
jgi:hypothetical protein